MKFFPGLLAAVLIASISLSSASAEIRPDNEIPPEGYFDATGRLIMPLRKVIGGMKLIANDLGSAFAGCPSARPKLSELKAMLDVENIAILAERGVSKDEYTTLWKDAYTAGQSRPVSAAECDNEMRGWQLMYEQIVKELQ